MELQETFFSICLLLRSLKILQVYVVIWLACCLWSLHDVQDAFLWVGMATKAQSIKATKANPWRCKPQGHPHLTPRQRQQQSISIILS